MQKCRERMGADQHHRRKPASRQAQADEESWEPRVIRDLPALEDIDDENVFMISCQRDKANLRDLPLADDIEIEGT